MSCTYPTSSSRRRFHAWASWFLGLGVLVMGAACSSESAYQVRFTIDMRPAVEAGWFDPDAETVGIRGGTAPLSWERTLPATDEDGDGRYDVTVLFPKPTRYREIDYKFKVDGTNNPNDGWETGRNRQVELGEEAVAIDRAFDAPPPALEPTFTGTIRTHETIASEHLDHPRDVFVYLPPGYDDDPERRYPVLYLHDGQNIFDASAVGAEWEADETAERLIEAGAIEPLIIVGVSNTPARISEYTPTQRTWRHDLVRTGGEKPVTDALSVFIGTYQVVDDPEHHLVITRRGDSLLARLPAETSTSRVVVGDDGSLFVPRAGITLRPTADQAGRVERFVATKPPEGGLGDAYGRFLVEELKPFIDQTYRTQPGPEHTGLGGSSLGGLITMYLGLKYPDVFGTLLVVSPAAWWDDEVVVRQVQAAPQNTDQRIWLDMGSEEGPMMLESVRHLRDALTEKGWIDGEDLHYLEEEGGQHNERDWARRFEAMLRFAFPALSDT